MSDYADAPARPLRVAVAGGGIAGLETLVALRSLAGDLVQLTLVAPNEDFSLRALSVLEPFGLGPARRYPLAALTADLGAEWHRDSVARVDRERRTVTLGSAAELAYDILVIAVGAIPYPAFEHGIVFDRAGRSAAFAALLADLRSGRAGSVAVVVPRHCAWTLPGYELALLLAQIESEKPAGRPAVTLVTSEPQPLAAFGPSAGDMIRGELGAAGVELLCDSPAVVRSARLVDLPHARRLRVARVVHLPLLAGPRVAGVPSDADGFIPVDADLQVDDDPDLFAAGDGVAAPYKQGGIAAQQADAVAERIALRAGAQHRAGPNAPVLRAVIWTRRGPRYLRAEPGGGEGDCVVSDQCLWWPPSKVASRWLTPWLASRDLGGAPAPGHRAARGLPRL